MMTTLYKAFLFVFLLLFTLGCSDSTDAGTFSPPNNQPNILNGSVGTHSQFPSIIVFARDDGTYEWCSASLIKPDLILTAAHCTAAFDMLDALYGVDTLPEEPCPSCVLKLKNYKTHPEYSQYETPWHDVAVVLLEEEIPDAITIDLLPSGDLLSAGDTVTIAGYGQTEESTSGTLMYGDAPVWALYDTEEMVLGDIENPDAVHACYGDSGGPAYFIVGDIVYLVGITSRAPEWAWGCGEGAVYTRPEVYTEWIEIAYEQLKNGKDPPDGGTGGTTGSGGTGGTGGTGDIPGTGGDEPEEEIPILDKGCGSGGCITAPVNSGNYFIIGLIFIVGLLRRKMLP